MTSVPVVDQTGLTGFYDFTLSFLPQNIPEQFRATLPARSPGPPQHLSLPFMTSWASNSPHRRARSPTSSIDHIERPHRKTRLLSFRRESAFCHRCLLQDIQLESVVYPYEQGPLQEKLPTASSPASERSPAWGARAIYVIVALLLIGWGAAGTGRPLLQRQLRPAFPPKKSGGPDRRPVPRSVVQGSSSPTPRRRSRIASASWPSNLRCRRSKATSAPRGPSPPTSSAPSPLSTLRSSPSTSSTARTPAWMTTPATSPSGRAVKRHQYPHCRGRIHPSASPTPKIRHLPRPSPRSSTSKKDNQSRPHAPQPGRPQTAPALADLGQRCPEDHSDG